LNCDIFIRSYWKDLEWLQLCLASVEKYCRGFRSVVVVLPRSSGAWLRRCTLAPTPRVEFCRDYRDDYLGQQVTKLLADTFTDADYICHVDSDCIFSRPTTPRDFISDDKPRILTRPCALIEGHRPWQAPTERFLGWSVADDFMQHPPFVYPRWLYPQLREHALTTHGVGIEKYVTAQPPRGFSEFNVLGGFAQRRHRERFVWVDTSVRPPGPTHCRWYWSWGGLDGTTRREIAGILDAPDKP
jgi:hypothetical protein